MPQRCHARWVVAVDAQRAFPPRPMRPDSRDDDAETGVRAAVPGPCCSRSRRSSASASPRVSATERLRLCEHDCQGVRLAHRWGRIRVTSLEMRGHAKLLPSHRVTPLAQECVESVPISGTAHAKHCEPAAAPPDRQDAHWPGVRSDRSPLIVSGIQARLLRRPSWNATPLHLAPKGARLPR